MSWIHIRGKLDLRSEKYRRFTLWIQLSQPSFHPPRSSSYRKQLTRKQENREGTGVNMRVYPRSFHENTMSNAVFIWLLNQMRLWDVKYSIYLEHLKQSSQWSGVTMHQSEKYNCQSIAQSNTVIHNHSNSAVSKYKQGLVCGCCLTACAFYFLVNWSLFHSNHQTLSSGRKERPPSSPLLPLLWDTFKCYYCNMVKE